MKQKKIVIILIIYIEKHKKVKCAFVGFSRNFFLFLCRRRLQQIIVDIVPLAQQTIDIRWIIAAKISQQQRH